MTVKLLIRALAAGLRNESRFLLEQKWGIRKTRDPFNIPKYILKRYLPSDPVIIDCGAHIGADSIELARVFPNGSIHCFEPVPHIFDKLKKNTATYKNIYCYQQALGTKNGKSIMFVSSGSSDASSSLLQPTGHKIDHPDVLFNNEIEVSTVSLDSWAYEHNIAGVDFLWLDMQGFEYQMLKESKLILPTVKAIHTEVSTREVYENSILYTDLKDWMVQNGFEELIKAIPEKADMGNVLFVKTPGNINK